MRITVADRLKPFSHIPGAYFVLPHSYLRFQIFPALIKVSDLSHTYPRPIAEIKLNVAGPVENFTAQQDLEKGYLRVWGHTTQGFMRYRIEPSQDPLSCALVIEKRANDSIDFFTTEALRLLRKSEKNEECYVLEHCDSTKNFSMNSEFLSDLSGSVVKSTPVLSLGCNKAQDYDLMWRRCDMHELLPLWFRLGQLVPETRTSDKGVAFLLKQCQDTIERREITQVVPFLKNLFRAGFDVGFSPRLVDEQHQGFQLPALTDDAGSPLQLLSEGARLIRSLFVMHDDKRIDVLPVLPPEFHCGRLVGVRCAGMGTCDIEWTKKLIRLMVLRAEMSGKIAINFQKDVKRYRLREEKKGLVMQCGHEIEVEAGKEYSFDCFES